MKVDMPFKQKKPRPFSNSKKKSFNYHSYPSAEIQLVYSTAPNGVYENGQWF